MKNLIGTCVNNPFRNLETLSNVIDRAREITKRTFLKHCFIEKELKAEFKQFPVSFAFFKYKNIYFYTWSAIEHFYL